MATQGWIDPKSRYIAHGDVSGGRMTNASVTDNNGYILGENYSFNSESEFFAWARKRAGISW